MLAIAAARLGWDPVTAVEIEPGAPIAANARRNGVAVAVVQGDAPNGAPAVLANLPRPALLTLPRRPALLVASGFLAREADEVVAALGMDEQRRVTEGEWAAVVLR